MTLDLIQTVAFAGLTLFGGYGLKKLLPVLERYNIPAPVAGGLPVAAAMTLCYVRGWQPLTFDTVLQAPLQNAFFTAVGFGASLRLLRRGGLLLVVFAVTAVVTAALQNVVGGLSAAALGQHPLMGVLAGSVTLTGGPATGLAFAPQFEAAGVAGAPTLAVASAMVGIVCGGVLGGPISALLLVRRRDGMAAFTGAPRQAVAAVPAAALAEAQFPEPQVVVPAGEDLEAYPLLKHLVVMIATMAAGTWVSGWIAAAGITFPAYIGAMLVAAVVRNVDDATGAIGLSQRTIDDIGTIALSLFLAMALMTLRLWELAGLVLPLLAILAVQVLFIALLCLFLIPRLMGNDYDAVVMSSGFCGFMLGTTANAMANMGVLVERYGPAPKAYLVVPLVGTIFLDFFNALIITAALNFWR